MKKNVMRLEKMEEDVKNMTTILEMLMLLMFKGVTIKPTNHV